MLPRQVASAFSSPRERAGCACAPGEPKLRKGSSFPCAGCCSTPVNKERSAFACGTPEKSPAKRMGKPNQTPTPVASRDVPAVITNHLASASWSAGEGDLAGRKKKRREKETRGGERNGGEEGRRQRRVCGATPGVGLATGGAGWMSLETTRRSAAPRMPYGEREISCICARTSRDLSRCARREGSRRGSVTCCLLAEKPRTCLG